VCVCVQILKCQLYYHIYITFILKLLAGLLLGSYCTVEVVLETVLGNRILFEVAETVDFVCDGVEYFHSNTELFSVTSN